MRISQNMIYSGSIQYMNSALSNLAAAQEQNASQKKINRPSDDPAGYAEARNLDTIIKTLDQYSDNIGVAKSWLNQADSTLLEVSTAMTSIRELAEQAATGTLSSENRQEIATQVRALFSQVLSLANTTVSGNSLFAGQKTDGAAYTEVLYATMEDQTLTQDAVVSVAGGSDTSVLVHFSNSGTIGGTAGIAYSYSSDCGATWTSGTLAAGSTTLDLGGCSVTLKSGSVVTRDRDRGRNIPDRAAFGHVPGRRPGRGHGPQIRGRAGERHGRRRVHGQRHGAHREQFQPARPHQLFLQPGTAA